jgi:hypothetical protein
VAMPSPHPKNYAGDKRRAIHGKPDLGRTGS